MTANDNQTTNIQQNTRSLSLQTEIAEKMLDGFDIVLNERKSYYQANPDKLPIASAIPSIINAYTAANIGISGGISMIPGPLGLVATIPEIVLIIRNQLAMIYDIGMAYGKSEVLNRELLIGILLSSFGTSAGGLLIMHGSKIIVRRTSLRLFQRIVAILAGKITQSALKSMLSKWFPIVGAIAMATWSGYTTRRIGRKAAEILEKQIEVSQDESDDESLLKDLEVEQVGVSDKTIDLTDADFEIMRVKTLINLMGADQRHGEEEHNFIATAIERSALQKENKEELMNLLSTKIQSNVDFSVFISKPDEAVGLLMDLIAFAKHDGEFHAAERIYIKQVAKLMGISESDIEEILIA